MNGVFFYVFGGMGGKGESFFLLVLWRKCENDAARGN